MKSTGAELIIKCIEQQGVTMVTGIPGGSNLPLYNALYRSHLRHILARHEQGACFIAQGIARSSGKPAVCFATSGPGATNLITALADAKTDSVPLVVITGQVPTTLIGTDAFQEIDIVSMCRSITKHIFSARSAADLATMIPDAFAIAASGRPGPVLIDVPKDIQQQDCILPATLEGDRRNDAVAAFPQPAAIASVIAMLTSAERPVLYIGGGVMHPEAAEHIKQLSALATLPVASTLMGLGCMSVDNPLYLGMPGMHGSLATNMIMNECDLLLAFGVRFGDRAIGLASSFCNHARIVHVNIDPKETDKIIKADLTLPCDAGRLLELLCKVVEKKERREWYRRIEVLKKTYPLHKPADNHGIHPCHLLADVGAAAPSDVIITTDVGQHQMWVAQYYPFRGTERFLTSGGLGTMGFGLPVAIGAALANPDRQVVCFSGDGSLLMNIQELATLAELHLNVKLLLFNNNQLGLVRQQQDLFYRGNLIASKFIGNPDFVTIAKGFGIQGTVFTGNIDWKTVFTTGGPFIVEIPIHPKQKVLPMVKPGAANYEMVME